MMTMIGMVKTTMTMIGKKNKQEFGSLTLNELFIQQMVNQDKMLDIGLYDDYKMDGTKSVPVDDIRLASYHVQHLMSEVGEVLDADKRWKNFRNEKCDKNAKLEEIADCFIVLMNISMFSGINGEELSKAIKDKLDKVSKRVENI